MNWLKEQRRLLHQRHSTVWDAVEAALIVPEYLGHRAQVPVLQVVQRRQLMRRKKTEITSAIVLASGERHRPMIPAMLFLPNSVILSNLLLRSRSDPDLSWWLYTKFEENIKHYYEKKKQTKAVDRKAYVICWPALEINLNLGMASTE